MRASATLPWLLAALGAAALSGWLYREALDYRAAASREGHVPDAFVEGMILSTLDAGGRLRHRVWAERGRHYADDDSTELDAPRAELYRPDEPPWRARARQGWLSGDGERVRLEGAVDIRRPAAAGRRPVSLRTEALTLLPRRDYAETDVAVHYRTTGLDVDGVGMRAFLDQGRVELQSRVRGTYRPMDRPRS